MTPPKQSAPLDAPRVPASASTALAGASAPPGHASTGLRLDDAAALRDDQGRRFEPAQRVWQPGAALTGGQPLDRRAAVRWLQRDSGHPLRTPIGVIGPREATDTQLAAARVIGEGLARMGLTVVCGGRHGVMQAVAEGVHVGGGVSIGMLPDATPELANPFLTHVIATGLGEARNAIIARSAHLLIAIGDSYGTLSEVALGLQFGKPVLGLDGAARVDGVQHHATPDSALNAVAALLIP